MSSSVFENFGDSIDVLRCPEQCGSDYVEIDDIAVFENPKGLIMFGHCGHCKKSGIWRAKNDKGRFVFEITAMPSFY